MLTLCPYCTFVTFGKSEPVIDNTRRVIYGTFSRQARRNGRAWSGTSTDCSKSGLGWLQFKNVQSKAHSNGAASFPEPLSNCIGIILPGIAVGGCAFESPHILNRLSCRLHKLRLFLDPNSTNPAVVCVSDLSISHRGIPFFSS